VPYSLFSNFFLLKDENLIPSMVVRKPVISTDFRLFGPKVAEKKIPKNSKINIIN